MEIILGLSFIIGGLLGLYMPIQRDIMISIGSILINVIGSLNVILMMILSGYVISIFIINVLKGIESNLKQEKVSENKIKNTCIEYLMIFLGVFLLALFTFSIIPSTATSSLLITLYSITRIFKELEHLILHRGEKGTIRRIVGFLMLVFLANSVVSHFNSTWATTAYFTVLLTLSNFKKSELEQENEERKLGALDALLYGVSGNSTGPIYAPIILAQALAWGSQKDTLGTILNLVLPPELESFRILWGLLTFLVILITGVFHISSIKNNPINTKNSNKNILNFLKYCFTAINIILIISQLGLIFVIFLCILGILINLCIDKKRLRQFAVPMLLIGAGL